MAAGAILSLLGLVRTVFANMEKKYATAALTAKTPPN
jgi:hypothetical protein